MIPDVSIIVPAYNEANAIRGGKLLEIMEWCTSQFFRIELLVVDDGSDDDTAVLASEQLSGPIGRVLTIPHSGKAAAIMHGIEASNAETLLFTDMDLATPIDRANALIVAINGDADIAIGSRGYTRRGAPLGRRVMSWGQVVLRTLMLGITLPDTQCGFKAFKRKAALHVLENLHVYHPTAVSPRSGPSVTSGFDVEFLYVAARLGYKIRAIPVDWHYEVSRRVDLRRDSLRGVRDLYAICAAHWRGAYSSGRAVSPSIEKSD